MNENKVKDRDWVNSDAQIRRMKIERAEMRVLRAILERNKTKYRIAMSALSKAYNEDINV